MAMKNLKTVWGEGVTDKPLQEYPRPQFVRDSYINLNGKWDYVFTKYDSLPQNYEGKILVPFSPESVLSGVGRQLQPDEYLFYRTTFRLPKNFNRGIVLLHFGAVDSIADVYVNDLHAATHVGGYNSFTVDVTPYLKERNVLVVRVRDFSDSSFHTSGKQLLKRGGMWYTAQSGVWQTVWLESVPTEYIEDIKITPNFDDASVTVGVKKNFNEPVTVIVTENGREVAKSDGTGAVTVRFPDGNFVPWTPENPHLYGMKIVSRRDYAESYFGMRKFSVQKVWNDLRIMLNNKPYFQNGVLDQGYWSDGLYTAPSDEALVYDIATMKKLGFNMLRKHIKVEPLRWYYHCDRLGMLVWQDMPSGGTSQHKWFTLYLPHVVGLQKMKDNNYRRFSRKSAESRSLFMREYEEMLDQLYNCTCICTWVPFNEGWGQFDANKVAEFTKRKDPSRLCDHASGWHDQGGGDLRSVHVYFRKVYMKRDPKRAVVLSEFGGFGLKVADHSANEEKTYVYSQFADKDALQKQLELTFRRDVVGQIEHGLCASVYTQVSDVEDEVNGLLTFDRKVLKVDEEFMARLNAEVKI